MRRPGLWATNGHPGDTVSAMLGWRPGAITCYYDYLGPNKIFDYKAANPEATIIVRFQHPRQWRQNPSYFARQLGEQVASKWGNMKSLDPYVYFANEMNYYYENGDNNPNNQHLYTTPEFYQQYAAWVRRTADVIKNIVPEMKLITPPLAYGHREDGAPDDDGRPKEGWAGYDYLYETVRDYFDNILTFHGYWGHAGGSEKEWLYDPQLSSWYAFRWRRVLKLFETRYGIQARMIIDEAGNFAVSDPDFTDQVIYYAEKCLNDRRVLALTYFLWHDPTNSPGNMPNEWLRGIPDLAGHLARLKNMPDVPALGPDPSLTQDQTIRVLFDDNTVQTMRLEEYLRAVVPAEMPALWPAEAVKAQAVACRTYAHYAIENPRYENADICTNPARCQSYDPAKIHPRSDEAIKQTKGLIARYNGHTVNALFSANCGGHTRDAEDVFGGQPLPYLQGVPCPNPGPKRGHGVGLCQYGARDLAQQDRTYEEIIKHYYTGATVGPPTTTRTSNVLGTVLDQTGGPAGAVTVRISGADQAVETATKADGAFRFNNVPAGTYLLEIPAYEVSREITPTPGQDSIITLTLPPPRPKVIVEVERLPGLPLIIGDWGEADARILIRTPSGQLYQTATGFKPEFGPGGFEIYAPETGTYTLTIDTYEFDVLMQGQTARLIFRWQNAGVIEGILRNHQNQPVGARRINLSGEQTKLAAVTDQNGYFLFTELPAGHYLVMVEDSQIRQEVEIRGRNRVAVALKFAAPPGTEEWQIKLERGQGLPLLVGDIGLPNRSIVITAPSGDRIRVTSGSKPEFGRGGFEIYATETGNYTIEFEGERFIIPMTGQFTHVTFTHSVGAADERVRLISELLPRFQAETLLQTIEQTTPQTRDLFEIVKFG